MGYSPALAVKANRQSHTPAAIPAPQPPFLHPNRHSRTPTAIPHTPTVIPAPQPSFRRPNCHSHTSTVIPHPNLSFPHLNRHPTPQPVIPAQAGIQNPLPRPSVAQAPGNGKTNRFPENRKTLSERPVAFRFKWFGWPAVIPAPQPSFPHPNRHSHTPTVIPTPRPSFPHPNRHSGASRNLASLPDSGLRRNNRNYQTTRLETLPGTTPAFAAGAPVCYPAPVPSR